MKKVICLATALIFIGCSDYNPLKPDLPDGPDKPGGGSGGGKVTSTSIFAKPQDIAKDLELKYVSWNKYIEEEPDTITIRLKKIVGETAHFVEEGYPIIEALDSNGMCYNEFAISVDGDYAYFKGHSRLLDYFITERKSLYLGEPENVLEKLDIKDEFLYLNLPDRYATVFTTNVHGREYEDLSFYHDPTPTFVDGTGEALLYTREKGVVASQYFGNNFGEYYTGGFTLLED